MSKEKLVIVDADGLIYHSSRETLEESIQVLNEKIQNIYDKTEATHSIFFISPGKYFRHGIDPNYKKSRDNTKSPLKWLQTLKMYLKEAYNAQSMKNCEADDLCAYFIRKKIYLAKPPTGEPYLTDVVEGDWEHILFENILSTPDKDMLKGIEGRFFTYSYRLVDKTRPESVEKGWWVDTSDSEARDFSRGQLIFGDVGDSVGGLPKKGEKYWEKMCLSGRVNLTDILEEYITYYGESQGIYEFQKNYRLLHLLSTDADFIQEIGELPTFPIVNSVTKEIKTDYI